jgi:hypothetical protein
MNIDEILNPKGVDNSFNVLMGENFQPLKAQDREYAKNQYIILTEKFRNENPQATAAQLDAVNAKIRDNLSGYVKTNEKGQTVEYGSEGYQKNVESFNNNIDQYRSRQLSENTQLDVKKARMYSAQKVFGGMGDILNTVDSNPDTAPELMANLEKMGASEGMDSRSINKAKEHILEAQVGAMVRMDPKQALDYLDKNASLYGDKILDYKNKARTAINTQEKVSVKAAEKEAYNALPINMEAVRSKYSENSPEGVAARKAENNFNTDSNAYVKQRNIVEMLPLNFESPIWLDQRKFQSDEAADLTGRKVNLLDSSEIKAVTQRLLNPNDTAATLDWMYNTEDSTRQKLADQIDIPALGWAVRLPQTESVLQNKILEGYRSSDKGENFKEVVFPKDPVVQKQAAGAIEALTKVGFPLEEARQQVLNEQEIPVNDWIPFNDYKVPIPHGFNAIQFKGAAKRLFNDPDLMAKYSNGDPYKATATNGNKFDFDIEKVKFYVIRPGYYGIEYDGAPMATDKNKAFVINMEAYLRGE